LSWTRNRHSLLSWSLETVDMKSNTKIITTGWIQSCGGKTLFTTFNRVVLWDRWELRYSLGLQNVINNNIHVFCPWLFIALQSWDKICYCYVSTVKIPPLRLILPLSLFYDQQGDKTHPCTQFFSAHVT
jgi:hypothetical protein